MDWVSIGYFGLFLATFLAATVVPFSSEAILLTTLAAGFDPILCLIVATLGNTLGGITSYFLGFIADWHKLQSWLRVKESSIMKWKKHSDRFGPYLALLCWAPFVGDVIAIALGVFRVRLIPVFTFMFLGKLVRYIVVFFAFEVIQKVYLD